MINKYKTTIAVLQQHINETLSKIDVEPNQKIWKDILEHYENVKALIEMELKSYKECL